MLEITIHWVKIKIPKLINLTIEDMTTHKKIQNPCKISETKTNKANFFDQKLISPI